MKKFIERINSSINHEKLKLNKIVLFLGLIIIGTIIFSGVVSAANPLSTSPQPQLHYNNLNTGQSQFNGPQTNHTRWIYRATNTLGSSPVIGNDGTIYVGCYDHNLYAIKPNGKLKWKYKTASSITASPAISSDGTIYLGNYNSLDAINPNGTLKWKYKTGHDLPSNPVISSDGTVYIGMDNFKSNSHNLYAINPDGTLKWKYTPGDYIFSSPTLGIDGTIYIGCHNDYLYAINPNGKPKWKFKTGNGISSPTISSDGTIYVGSDYLYAIYPNGTLKWKYQPDKPEKYMYTISSPAIGNDGTLYFDRGGYNLYAVNPNGTFKYKYNIGHFIGSIPAIGNDGTIYIGSKDGPFTEFANDNLYAINPNGKLKWKYHIICPVYHSPVISSDGTLYVASCDLFAFHDAAHNITVTADHKSGVYNPSTLPITLKSNYPATIYYTLNGETPTDSSAIYKHPITITKDTFLRYFAIDSYGDISPMYIKGYIVHHPALKIKATIPIQGDEKFSRTRLIRIYFNEKIKSGVLYNYITIKNLRSNKYVHTVKAVVGNTLIINTRKIRSPNTWYMVTIPKWAVKDYYYAENRQNTTYTLKFKTKGL